MYFRLFFGIVQLELRVEEGIAFKVVAGGTGHVWVLCSSENTANVTWL